MEKYTIVRKIGEGSFGKALLVKSKSQGKQFVVKEINMSRMSKKERDEARKETAVLAQLNHSNIVTYRESFEDTGNLYIVMDYCDGGDLYGRINAQRGVLFNEEQVLDWFVQICLSLKHIHDRKILHRDIKSQNIFLTKHGIIKLGDFGIAKVLSNTIELARTCIGTPYYLSPEICENRPYNNKSDIWSLGCVLYEMATLKHAFEAGNMKNLVLKIIRGSYPPPPPKYSYELRNLIALLFKRNPRDRPSVNAILKKTLLQKRIKKYLSETEMEQEFSHTVMHGVKLKKQLPVGAPPARRTPAVTPSPRYDPSSVYAQPLVRKSRDAPKSARPSGGEARHSGERPSSHDLIRKRQELIEKEKQRRMEQRNKEKLQLARQQQQELNAKQRQARINKAREDGWRNVLSNSDEYKDKADAVPKPAPEAARMAPARPLPVPARPTSARDPPSKAAGNYEQYHQWLDRLQQQRQSAAAAAAEAGRAAAARGAEAAERARVVREFQERQMAAMRNKDRGQGLGLGAAAAITPRVEVKRPPSVPTVEERRSREQAEYLANLKQIRLQNFNERRMQQEREKMRAPAATPITDEAAIRKKKIEALKAQAEDKARRLKEELEAKRAEAKAKEQRRMQAQVAAAKLIKPPAMTEVMDAITPRPVTADPTSAAAAAGPAHEVAPRMTAAMDAIGAAQQRPQTAPEADRSPIKQQKMDILKRLNAKAAERPKWGQGGGGDALDRLTLEETASHMEETGHLDGVEQHKAVTKEAENDGQELPDSSRRQWGRPRDTVVNRLYRMDAVPDSPSDTLEAESPASTSSISIVAKSTFVIVTSPSSSPVASSSSAGGLSPAKVSPVRTAASVGTTMTIAKEKEGTVVLDKPVLTFDEEVSAAVAASEEIAEEVEIADTKELSAKGEQENPGMTSEKDSSLFDKVELEEEDNSGGEKLEDIIVEDVEEDANNSTIEDDGSKADDEEKSNNVKLGLVTGYFDIDVTMLRTCSEPDLTKLFRTQTPEEAFAEVHASMKKSPSNVGEENDDDTVSLPAYAEACAEDEETAADDVVNGNDASDEAEKEEEECVSGSTISEEEDEPGAEDIDDEEDWDTMRQSMMEILNDTGEEIDPLFVKTRSKTSKRKKKKKKTKQESRQSSESAEAELATMRETMRQVLLQTPRDTPVAEKPPEIAPNLVAGSESWESDRDEDDFFQCPQRTDLSIINEEEDDMYSRLEASRAKLETELGEQTFLKAYRTVQALHEDEEATVESGIEQVRDMLGSHQHLYPNILQLVMADGAFLEDNE